MAEMIITCSEWLPDADSFIKDQHLQTSDRELVNKLLTEAESCSGPIGGYLDAAPLDCTDDSVCLNGDRLHSKLLSTHIKSQKKVFPYVTTCGQELAAWVDSKTDVLDSYLAHAVAEQATYLVTEKLRLDIEARYGLNSLSRMQPGSLPDWPVEEQGPLFRILGQLPQKLQVSLTSSFLMLPSISLSGVFFQDPEGFISCQLCTRKCPRRKAPYDPKRLAELEGNSSVVSFASGKSDI